MLLLEVLRLNYDANEWLIGAYFDSFDVLAQFEKKDVLCLLGHLEFYVYQCETDER